MSCHCVDEVHRLLEVGVPDRARRRDLRLHAAVVQSGDRRAVGAVDLEGDEVVAPHARRPRHVELADHGLALVALQLHGRIGGVVGGRGVGPAVLVPALRDVRRAEARDRLHLAEQVVEHIAPVAHHVEDHPAAFLAAVVPRRPLDRLQVALEDPVAELEAQREHAAEEAGAAQHVELAQAGQEELVLDRAVLQPRSLRGARDLDRLVEVGRDRLLAVDVLAGAQCLRKQLRSHLGRAGVEEHRVLAVRQRGVEVRSPARDPVRARQRLDLFRVAADQDRVGNDAVAIGERDASFGADRADRADEVLVHSHPAGDAVHDDSESSRCHGQCSREEDAALASSASWMPRR